MANDLNGQPAKFRPPKVERGSAPRRVGNGALPMTILNAMPSPIILVDGRRRVVYVNPEAEELFDGAGGLDLSLTIRHPAVLSAVDLALAGKAPGSVEIALPTRVSRNFTLDVVPTDPPADDSGPGEYWALIVLHDVTRSRRAEQARADFVANVSHELRSPLAALIGFIETINGPARNDPEARSRFLNIMQREADRMSRLINDLLSLSKVEINEHILPTKRVEINTVVRQVVELLTVKARDRNMNLTLRMDDLNAMVQGDPDELNQVFQNLVDNAIKYGREGTDISIAIERIDRVPDTNRFGVAISIEDRGDGIPSEQLPRLTERFYRVDKARSRDMGGTGLGLAIVKHIVNRHRGKLSIRSREKTGSTFTVILPVVAP